MSRTTTPLKYRHNRLEATSGDRTRQTPVLPSWAIAREAYQRPEVGAAVVALDGSVAAVLHAAGDHVRPSRTAGRPRLRELGPLSRTVRRCLRF
jgi:hypothetical protein